MGARHSAVVEALLRLSPEGRRKAIKTMPPRMRVAMRWDWRVWARPGQVWTPQHKRHTVFLAGRGWGKTRAGSEAVRYAAKHPEVCGGQILLVGRTYSDVLEYQIEGVSGILAVTPPHQHPKLNFSKQRLEYPNGTIMRIATGDKPQSIRGPNVGLAWLDEMPHWQRPQKCMEMLRYVLRHVGGESAGRTYSITTTTPLGTEAVVRHLFVVDKETGKPFPDRTSELGYQLRPNVQVVTGSTYDNAANLADDFLEELTEDEGTELGQQEIHGKILLGEPDAIWKQDWFRRCEHDELPELAYVVIMVDPSVSETGAAAECGIAALGAGVDGKIYLLEDGSGAMSPAEWGTKALSMWAKWDADEIVLEDNQGGELVRVAIRSLPDCPQRCRINKVRAKMSKAKRAHAVAPAWELGRVISVGNPRNWVRLEHQFTHWSPLHPKKSKSDRMDAFVHGVAHLAGDRRSRRRGGGLGKAELWARIAKKVGSQ